MRGSITPVGPLVEDREQASLGRDHRAQARIVFVAAAPERTIDPLQPLRLRHHAVVRHRVAVGIVQKVGPLVDFFGPWLDGGGPLTRLLDVGYAPRHEHAQHFVAREVAWILGHEEVNHVPRKGEPFAVPRVDRYLAAKAHRLDALPGRCDGLRIDVEAMYQIAVVGPQRDGQLARSAPDMCDQPAVDAGGFQDLLRRMRRRRFGPKGPPATDHRQAEHGRLKQSKQRFSHRSISLILWDATSAHDVSTRRGTSPDLAGAIFSRTA